MLSELQIETIIAETCGTYRTGGSYTFEDVWNCIEKALAAHNAGAQALDPRDVLADTGHPEADRLIGRLTSADPDFDDCTDAAVLIRQLVAEHRGPDGYATWKDAAVAERQKRVEAERTAGAQEPVAQWQYRFFDGVKWVDWANCTELLVKHKDGRDDFQFRALFARARPQPMPQTDAARDAEDAKRYRFIKSQMKVGAVQTQLPLYRTLHWIGYEGCSDVHNADAVIDAEIERLDRAKGE